MDIVFVRHGESEGNAQRRMQGLSDYPLSEQGRSQARRLGAWLRAQDLRWDAAYASPLARARETAEIAAATSGYSAATADSDLEEVHAGSLEGLTREEMEARHPTFLERGIVDLGDFEAFGGESYDEVQERAMRFLGKLDERHRAAGHRVLVVAHGGILFQMLKRLICMPVPRVCIVRFGNCSASLIRVRERRGAWIGELSWHVPVELMGGAAGEGSSEVFR